MLKDSNRGQIEMFGLVIIVILISLVIIFVIRFTVLGGNNAPLEQDTVFSIRGNNLFNAITKYTVCGNTQMSDAIGACCSNSQICGQDACTLVNTNLNAILPKSMDFTEYEFKVENCNINIVSSKFNSCTNVIAASPYVIKSGNDLYTAKLRLCRAS